MRLILKHWGRSKGAMMGSGRASVPRVGDVENAQARKDWIAPAPSC